MASSDAPNITNPDSVVCDREMQFILACFKCHANVALTVIWKYMLDGIGD